jgi:hypothetical protein
MTGMPQKNILMTQMPQTSKFIKMTQMPRLFLPLPTFLRGLAKGSISNSLPPKDLTIFSEN